MICYQLISIFPERAVRHGARVGEFRIRPECVLSRSALREIHAGAIYTTNVSARTISIKVELPPSLALTGMTSDEAGRHERYLHRKVEDAIVWILRAREPQ